MVGSGTSRSAHIADSMTDDKGVVQGEVEDTPLDEEDLRRIREGKEPKGGKGVYPSFSDLPPETLREYQRRARLMMNLKKESRKLAELDAYMNAHKDIAGLLIGAKMAIISGLLDEMRVSDKHGAEFFDTRLLDEKRLKVLQQALNDWEKRGFGSPVTKQEQTVNVDVTHRLVQLAKQLGG